MNATDRLATLGLLLGFAAALVSLLLGVSLAAAAPPTATIETASEVSFNSAKAVGHVNPADHEAFYHFEYVSQAQFEAGEWAEASAVGFGSLPEGVGSTEVAETLGSLSPGTSYHLRLVAENTEGETAEAVAASFKTDAVNPPTATIDPVSTFSATTAHFSGTVNSGGSSPGEATEYRFSCDPICPGLEDFQPLTSDGSDQIVEAEMSLLEPNTTYTVTLFARNAQTEVEGEPVDSTTSFTTAGAAPIALAGTNSPDSDGSIEVRGYVNPRNSALTECHIQFGLTESYGQTLPCEGDLPQGGEAGEISVDLTGLQADTFYHFKVVATNAVGTGESDDGFFATPPLLGPPSPQCPNPKAPGASQLSDCRAWEMVSPPDKNGGDVTPGVGSIWASTAGGAVVFESNVAFADAIGTGGLSSVSYRADRKGQGWAIHSMTPRVEPGWGHVFTNYRPGIPWFSPDLSRALIYAINPIPALAPGAQEDIGNLYLTDGMGAGAELISPAEGPLTPDMFSGAAFVGASPNGRHVVFSDVANLTSATNNSSQKLYQWDVGVGLTLVSRLPDGSPATEDARLGGVVGFIRSGDRPLSDDGERVYFTTLPVVDEQYGQLYLRKNGATTTAVADSEASSPAPEPSASRFWAASSDGTRAFFTTKAKLLDEDQGIEDVDLYMYTDSADPVNEDNLTLVSEDGDATDGFQSEVEGVLGASENGRRVYFAASGRLIAGQPSRPIGLYLWEEGDIRFITSLSLGAFGHPTAENWDRDPATRSSRITPDGRFLTYSSTDAPAGGYDNAEHQETYRYDAQTREIVCVSCRPSGEEAAGDTSIGLPKGEPFLAHPGYGSRGITNDGSRVFFNSTDSLVPRDGNGRSDVYEWTASGTGGCDIAQGCISLISSGMDGEDSFFGDAGPDGSDVYFLTRDRLSGWDFDGGIDLYDARVDGGLPEPLAAVPGCEGDACLPSPVALNDATPASASFSGPAGNLRASPRKHRLRRKHRRKGHRRRHGRNHATHRHG